MNDRVGAISMTKASSARKRHASSTVRPGFGVCRGVGRLLEEHVVVDERAGSVLDGDLVEAAHELGIGVNRADCEAGRAGQLAAAGREIAARIHGAGHPEGGLAGQGDVLETEVEHVLDRTAVLGEQIGELLEAPK